MGYYETKLNHFIAYVKNSDIFKNDDYLRNAMGNLTSECTVSNLASKMFQLIDTSEFFFKRVEDLSNDNKYTVENGKLSTVVTDSSDLNQTFCTASCKFKSIASCKLKTVGSPGQRKFKQPRATFDHLPETMIEAVILSLPKEDLLIKYSQINEKLFVSTSSVIKQLKTLHLLDNNLLCSPVSERCLEMSNVFEDIIRLRLHFSKDALEAPEITIDDKEDVDLSHPWIYGKANRKLDNTKVYKTNQIFQILSHIVTKFRNVEFLEFYNPQHFVYNYKYLDREGEDWDDGARKEDAASLFWDEENPEISSEAINLIEKLIQFSKTLKYVGFIFTSDHFPHGTYWKRGTAIKMFERFTNLQRIAFSGSAHVKRSYHRSCKCVLSYGNADCDCEDGCRHENGTCPCELHVGYEESTSLPVVDEEIISLPRIDDKYRWFYSGNRGWWTYNEQLTGDITKAYNIFMSKKDVPEAFQDGKFAEYGMDNDGRFYLTITGRSYVIDFELMMQYQDGSPDKRRRIKNELIDNKHI